MASATLLKRKAVQGDEKCKRMTLLRTLRRLNIRPYTTESVDRYKQQAIRKATPLHTWGYFLIPKVWNYSGTAALTLLVIVYCIWCIGIPISPIFIFILKGLFACTFACTLLYGGFYFGTPVEIPVWYRVPIEVFGGRIPQEITALREEIALFYPQARFEIDFLILDPFLVVSNGRKRGRIKRYYIAVWDEHGFLMQ